MFVGGYIIVYLQNKNTISWYIQKNKLKKK